MLSTNDLPVVYLLDTDQPLTSSQLERIKKFIPRDRILSSQKFLFKKDGDACLASFFLLVYGLRMLNIYELPKIKKGENGKPVFTNSNICFNISHCDKAVCCGLSMHNIGVDVQDTVTGFDDIIGCTMSDREIELIRSADSPSEAFTRLWTLKESFVKFDGSGLTDDIRTIEFLNTENEFAYRNCFFNVEHTSEYHISVCSADKGTRFVRKSLNEYLDELEIDEH
ncbi:4'-phosphopantetheinyl transferase family protein [Ruminococcus flavefaciens]|uniref:4'-phosphopantetheinyl transferase family protein n=1 Tax=Ruminococcus flavefaciens TaxID=1265 RepID=UPI0004651D55|nr:4'-phosphopantetheinyl transferase superfamily protein [Ruminococcus flavefaciens]